MSAIQKHHGLFRYRNKGIPFVYWSNTDGDTPPDTIIFLGAGQIDRAPRWTAEFAGPGVIVVEALPHWHVHADEWDAREVCLTYQVAVLQEVLHKFQLHSVHIIAESQGGAVSIVLAQKLSRKIRSLVLIKPLGFNTSALGSSKTQRLRAFKRRLLINHLQYTQSLLHDLRNIHLKLNILRIILREPSWKMLNQKYADGVSYDVLPECREVATMFHRLGKPFVILLGEKDKLFPPDEVLAAIRGAGIKYVKTEVIPKASHASLAVRACKPILARALAIGRTRAKRRVEV